MKKPVLVLLVMCSLFSGCTSIIQKTGEVLDGSAFKEKTEAVFRNEEKLKKNRIELREIRLENNEKGFIISSNAYPGLKLRANLPKEDRLPSEGGFPLESGLPLEGGLFSFTQAEILSTHVHGWNHFTMDLLGEGFFLINGNNGSLNIANPPEGIQISQGKIRYKDNRIAGAEALANLQNRRERILALTGWMKAQDSGVMPLFPDQKEFEKYWKSRLFPELVTKKNQVEEYEKGDQWIQGNGVKWNRNYTQKYFPEELWELRDSGALLRDWEEAAAWIYMEYAWDSIMAFFNGQEFRKIK